MLRFLLPAIIFLVLTGFLYVGLYKDPTLVPSPLVGKPVPTFVAETLKNPEETITEKDLIGDYALVNVWATWCGACKQEHSALVYLAEKLNVPIYGLNYKDDREAAKAWLQQYGDPYKANVFDSNGRIAIDFGVYGAPETFLIDSKGTIQHKLVGVMTPEVWEKQFVPRIQTITADINK